MKYSDFITANNLKFQEHQESGFQWCSHREQEKEDYQYHHGGIIADEMGTGKTILMTSIIACRNEPKTLVVVPLPILHQWVVAFKQYTNLSCFVYYGASKKKINNNANIVVTTYGNVVYDFKKRGYLFSAYFDRVLFDEAHNMRNKKSQIHLAVSHLQCNIMWLLSGTPIQNKKSDFYNLCDVMKIQESKSIEPEELSKIIIRRTKEDANIHMPMLMKANVRVPWDEREKMLCMGIHSRLFPNGGNANDCEVFQKQSTNIVNKFGTFHLPYYLRAKQMCVCPTMLYKQLGGETVIMNSKLRAVSSKILSRNNGNKKLVFCQFREEMKYLNDLLAPHVNCEIYDGSLSKQQRTLLLERDPMVLIIQIKMGCEGLNLQSRNEIYFVSPFWNPGMESQAIGRCYRYGQQKTVIVFKFFMEDVDFHGRSQTLDSYVQGASDKKVEIMNQMFESLNI